MIKIGIPVIDQHELTKKCINYLAENSTIPGSVEVVIIDNGSDKPYDLLDYMNLPFSDISLKWNGRNRGYYQPLLQVLEGTTDADIVGLMHNDLFIYEKGWDRRLLDSFLLHPRLGMVGVCGSDHIDERGGRGGGTMCNFAGRVGQLQEHTGKRIAGLHRALIFDSMFLAMRSTVANILDVDQHTTLCHFMDKLWPLKAINNGWLVAVLGLEVDHIGGQTAVIFGNKFEQDAADWCKQEGIPFWNGKNGDLPDSSQRGPTASLALYLESERRFLTYGKQMGMIPSKL